jgi:MFS family permease
MGLLGELFEAAMNFAGIIGVVLLLGAIIFGVAFAGMMTFAGVGVTWMILTEDKDDKPVPWRVVLIIGVLTGLCFIRWYVPLLAVLAAAAASPLVCGWELDRQDRENIANKEKWEQERQNRLAQRKSQDAQNGSANLPRRRVKE